MIIIDNTTSFLCQLNKDQIFVNDISRISSYNPVVDDLTVFLMNVKKEAISFENPRKLTAETVNEMIEKSENVSDTSYIKLTVPFGEGEDAFIDSQNNNMSISAPGWMASPWRVHAQDLLTCIVLCDGKSIKMERFESINVKIKEIISFLNPGMTYINVEFCNINGMDHMMKTLPIARVSGQLQINQFYPEHYVLQQGEGVRLFWKTGAATEGYIHPTEYKVDTISNQLTVTPEHSTEYILEVRKEDENQFGKCQVFVASPAITKFDVDEKNKNISWQTKYSTAVYLNNDKVDIEGTNVTISEGTDEMELRVNGYLYSLSKKIFLLCARHGFTRLEKEVRRFSGYQVVTIEWESNYVEVNLEIYHPNLSVAYLTACGRFEYALDEEDAQFKIVGLLADGSKESVYI